jgi:hypothetical protein
MGQLARRATALADQENEGDLVQALHRLVDAAEQVQRRCQLLIARHAGLRAGRITATSRKVRAGIVNRCGESATLPDVLELLTKALARAQAATVHLAAENQSGGNEGVTDFAEFVILVWSSVLLPSSGAIPGQAGHRESAEKLAIAAIPCTWPCRGAARLGVFAFGNWRFHPPPTARRPGAAQLAV